MSICYRVTLSSCALGPHAVISSLRVPTEPKKTDRQRFAAELLNDEEYRKNLLTRLRAGMVAPALEVLLYQYWLGKPADEVVLYDARDLAGKSREELQQRLQEINDRVAELTRNQQSVH
jgi:hypothetical protein